MLMREDDDALSLLPGTPPSWVAGDGLAVERLPTAYGTLQMQARQRDGVLTVALRSEEHTSELQSQSNLVCRLLLEKKKNENRDSPHLHNSEIQIPSTVFCFLLQHKRDAVLRLRICASKMLAITRRRSDSTQ